MRIMFPLTILMLDKDVGELRADATITVEKYLSILTSIESHHLAFATGRKLPTLSKNFRVRLQKIH
jgi:hypothetical protein